MGGGAGLKLAQSLHEGPYGQSTVSRLELCIPALLRWGQFQRRQHHSGRIRHYHIFQRASDPRGCDPVAEGISSAHYCIRHGCSRLLCRGRSDILQYRLVCGTGSASQSPWAPRQWLVYGWGLYTRRKRRLQALPRTAQSHSSLRGSDCSTGLGQLVSLIASLATTRLLAACCIALLSPSVLPLSCKHACLGQGCRICTI